MNKQKNVTAIICAIVMTIIAEACLISIGILVGFALTKDITILVLILSIFTYAYIFVSNYFGLKINKQENNITIDNVVKKINDKSEEYKVKTYDEILSLRKKQLRELRLMKLYILGSYLLYLVTFILCTASSTHALINPSMDDLISSSCFAVYLPVLFMIISYTLVNAFTNAFIKERNYIDIFQVPYQETTKMVLDVIRSLTDKKMSKKIEKRLKVTIENVSNCAVKEEKKEIDILIGIPLLAYLSNDELKAVLYHECGHIINKDTSYSLKVDRLIDSINKLASPKNYTILCPYIPKLLIKKVFYDNLTKSFFENEADNFVLKQGIGPVYASAVIKIFALAKKDNYLGSTVNQQLENNKKWNKETIELYLDEKGTFINSHLDYYDYVSKNHLDERISTHPNIRKRREKFSKGNLDLSVKRNHAYDHDINLFFNRIDLSHYREDKNEKLVSYLKTLKNRYQNGDELDQNEWLELAMDYFENQEYEDCKKCSKKYLEKRNNLLLNYFLGYIETSINLSEEGIDYYLKCIDAPFSDTQADALKNLGQYALEMGLSDLRESLRDKQVEIIENRLGYESYKTLNVGDELLRMDNDELVEKIVNLAKESKDIKRITFSEKKCERYNCVYLVCYLEENANMDELYFITHQMYILLKMTYTNCDVISVDNRVVKEDHPHKRDELTIYKK